MSQEDIVSHLTKRIEILVKEIDKLTDIVNNNVVEQAELTEKYNDLLKAYQQQELQLKTSEEKLATHFRQHLQSNLERIREDKEAIGKLLSDSRAEVLSGTQHPLYILCQEKISVEQQLRGRINELEKHNALLHSENARLRSFIQHDRMFQQMEQLAGHKPNLFPVAHGPNDPLSPKNVIPVYHHQMPQPQVIRVPYPVDRRQFRDENRFD